MKRTLLLGCENYNLFFPWLTGKTLTLDVVYKAFGLKTKYYDLRLLRKLRLLREDEVTRRIVRRVLRPYDRIIIWSYQVAEALEYPGFLEASKGKLLVYFWDTLERHYPPEKTAEYLRLAPGYSFQQTDCDAYGLRFASQFYIRPPEGFLPVCERKWDVCFIGYIHIYPDGTPDRLEVITGAARAFAQAGLSVNFNAPNGAPYFTAADKENGITASGLPVPYFEYLKTMVAPSRSIFDCYRTGQTGFSLRIMEHMFFSKKLITTNPLVRTAEFYNPANIFLYGEDDISTLKAWLEIPFEPVPEEIKEYYTVERWLERFDHEA
ncbi:MAG: hypothetical protein LBR73_07650 [Oscillospiraceae bacterium]|jgi:hypothetical protein|nr:hypothetical protein [Oscillospiraceae bacterium]